MLKAKSNILCGWERLCALTLPQIWHGKAGYKARECLCALIYTVTLYIVCLCGSRVDPYLHIIVPAHKIETSNGLFFY